MPWTSKHLKWLVNTGKTIKSDDGKRIEIWELSHKQDEEILSAWARHFRNHYCLDSQIDNLRSGLRFSRSEYLKEIKFPDCSKAPGPSIRSGDFGEILVADYLQHILGYWVPRGHYANKQVRDESIKGCDIIGFRYHYNGKDEKDDILAIFETKAQFSGKKANPRLQDAINGSAKDNIRKAESLNAIKQRLLDQRMNEDATKLERFQDIEGRPYRDIYGAVALFSDEVYDEICISKANAKDHPNKSHLVLLVIHGNNMMDLVHELYRRAADEA